VKHAHAREVWEESEFCVALSWKIDPDGSLGIRRFFESPYRPGQPITMDEYYGWMFESAVPVLPDAAAKEQLTPLQYMRKYGVFKVSDKSYSRAHERPLSEAELNGGVFTPDGTTILRDGACAGVVANGVACAGFNTPSRRLEFYSPTLAAWSWPQHSIARSLPGPVFTH